MDKMKKYSTKLNLIKSSKKNNRWKNLIGKTKGLRRSNTSKETNMPNENEKNNEKLEEDYQILMEELNHANNLIDYFLVIGISPEIFKEEWLYNTDLEELNQKYQKELEPKIISFFPPITKNTICFDESIISHCFPRGYNLIKAEKKPRSQLFSFILDNNYYNLNYPQKYLTCMVIYEQITQYNKLYEQYIKLTTLLSVTPKIEKCKFENIYIPKCFMIMSLYPYFGEFERILSEVYNYSLGITYNDTEDINLQKLLSIKQTEKKPTEIIYMPIDKTIENLLIELPVPPRGIFRVEYTLNNHQRKLTQNLMNELPYVDINLKKIFIFFDTKNIINIYRHLFLETRLLFFSDNIELLNIFIYGFLSLLYPFQYQYQVVTILPKENFEIMESITPFIAGINESYDNQFFEINNLTLSDCVLVIDIDGRRIELVNQQSPIPDFPKNYKKDLEKNLNNIFNKYLKQLIIEANKKGPRKSCETTPEMMKKNLMEISFDKNNMKRDTVFAINNVDITKNNISLKKNHIVVDPIYDIFGNFYIDNNFNKEINELFFNFNAKLLSNYSKYLNTDFYSSSIAPSLELLFKVDQYLKQFSSSDKEFYNKFITETQIFGDFLFMRMIPKSSKDKIQILAFDEKIIENSGGKHSKSNPSIFSKSQEYKFNSEFLVQKPHELTEKEIKYYKNSSNKIKMLLYGTIVKEENNKIIFEYPIFPKLTTEIFFKQNISQFIEPMNLNENIISINEDIISKSHLGGVKMRKADMGNYVNLCWLKMWALTFWYCYDEEKKYRFYQLLEVIKNTTNHEMEIFDLLFETLSINGKDYMILKLYEILLQLHLNPSLKVHNIVMKILGDKDDDKSFEEKIEISKKKSGITNFEIDKDEILQKKRTFKSRKFENILTENIIFYAFDACVDCQTEINLEITSQNYNEMTKDLMWSQCPACHAPMLPKLSIEFGEEINKIGSMKLNTSKYDCVVLFSPFNLKENYNNSLLKEYGIKVKVDEFMEKYNTIFWNSVWYFKLNNLPYDFMLPYMPNQQEFSFGKNLNVTTSKVFDCIKNESDKIIRYENNELKIIKSEFKIIGNKLDRKKIKNK